MGLTLHLGVVDIAYSDASSDGAKTTGDVAEILEDRFHIMQTFFELRRDQIAGALADSMAASIQRLVTTGIATNSRASLTAGADAKIETLFRAFIFGGEMDKLNYALTGQDRISAAAAAGVNHRLKRPYAKKNRARVSFVDTGLFVSSMRAWTTADVGAQTAKVSV